MQAGIGLSGGKRFQSNNFQVGISAVQYVQKPGYRLVVNMVKNDQFDKEKLTQFTRNLERVLPGMQINLAEVESIPSTTKGKRYFIINEDTELLRAMHLEGSTASGKPIPGQPDAT